MVRGEPIIISPTDLYGRAMVAIVSHKEATLAPLGPGVGCNSLEVSDDDHASGSVPWRQYLQFRI